MPTATCKKPTTKPAKPAATAERFDLFGAPMRKLTEAVFGPLGLNSDRKPPWTRASTEAERITASSRAAEAKRAATLQQRGASIADAVTVGEAELTRLSADRVAEWPPSRIRDTVLADYQPHSERLEAWRDQAIRKQAQYTRRRPAPPVGCAEWHSLRDAGARLAVINQARSIVADALDTLPDLIPDKLKARRAALGAVITGLTAAPLADLGGLGEPLAAALQTAHRQADEIDTALLKEPWKTLTDLVE